MTVSIGSASVSHEPPAADRVADELAHRLEAPWEIFGERLHRYELHLAGDRIEMRRGPIELVGFALRLFRPQNGALGVGVAASSDLSASGVERARAAAEASTRYSRFPARAVQLPDGAKGPRRAEMRIADERLLGDPEPPLTAFVHDLLAPFDGIRDVRPTFGSVRATIGESSLANSEGLRARYTSTVVDLEFAVKAFGGDEGRAPGEYWVNTRSRTLDPGSLGVDVDRWCRLARDVRRAGAPPSGELPVIFPTEVLSDVIPPVLGFRLSGRARLRQMANEAGSRIAHESLRISDDGTLPGALGSAPFDDEGVPHHRTVLVEDGEVRSLLYDTLYGAAFSEAPTGHARRGDPPFSPWFRFGSHPFTYPTTVSLDPGDGGSEEELIEAIDDGLWVDQLGASSPDPQSGTFGGEIRAGYRIHRGRLSEPVRGGTVGGFVIAAPDRPSLLTGLVGRGKRARTVGHFRAPTVRVDGLSIAGG
jgi:predicted Zn-dependent protease